MNGREGNTSPKPLQGNHGCIKGFIIVYPDRGHLTNTNSGCSTYMNETTYKHTYIHKICILNIGLEQSLIINLLISIWTKEMFIWLETASQIGPGCFTFDMFQWSIGKGGDGTHQCHCLSEVEKKPKEKKMKPSPSAGLRGHS